MSVTTLGPTDDAGSASLGQGRPSPSTHTTRRLAPQESSMSIDLTGESDDEGAEGSEQRIGSSSGDRAQTRPEREHSGVSGSSLGYQPLPAFSTNESEKSQPPHHPSMPASAMDSQSTQIGETGETAADEDVEYTGSSQGLPVSRTRLGQYGSSTGYGAPGPSGRMNGYGTGPSGSHGHILGSYGLQMGNGFGNYSHPGSRGPITNMPHARYPSQPSFSGFSPYRPSNISAPAVPSPFSSVPLGSYSSFSNMGLPGSSAFASGLGAGTSVDKAIDLTEMPEPPSMPSTKTPICIGAVSTRASSIYGIADAVRVGAVSPPESRHPYMVVDFRGAEFLKVRLKLRPAGQQTVPDGPLPSGKDAIQITLPTQPTYIGDIDSPLAEVLMPHMKRGLLRLEGFVQRVFPDSNGVSININILLFTLPSNVKYISSSLWVNKHFLLDPIPEYDPQRHQDTPPYQNAHGGHEHAMRARQQHQNDMMRAAGHRYGYLGAGGMYGSQQMDRAKQVEVQRAQIEEVFKTLDKGVELEFSDPGPLIKTELFPHQRKALTFLLQREADASSLKKTRKNFEKKMKKLKSRKGRDETADTVESGMTTPAEPGKQNGEHGDAEDGMDVDDAGEDKSLDEKARKKVEKEKERRRDDGHSLWLSVADEKGRVRNWKHKITGDYKKQKERPLEGKGAILADDMGLGKTLSVVSLIAATRSSGKKWLEVKDEEKPAESETKADVPAAGFKGRVFGMPEIEDEGDTSGSASAKKRKREESEQKKVASTKSSLVRSRGTLLVCPMSTITNWEDQIRDHWNGRVEIVGGSGTNIKDYVPKRKPIRKAKDDSDDSDDDEFDILRVYIYHGASKVKNASFLADFDVIITSYNTLALEFSQMSTSATGEDTPTTASASTYTSDDEFGDTSLNPRAVKPEVEAEIKAAEVADRLRKAETKKKGKLIPDKAGVMSPLQAVNWFRVVLDEAHYIKTASTVASKASCHLSADRRIALTGTPIQNKIEDVWALFKFLRLEPVDNRDVFQHYILTPCKAGNSTGVGHLQLIMRCCTLRRTKESTAEDGRKILNLPPKKELQLWLDFRDDERVIYNQRRKEVSKAARKFVKRQNAKKAAKEAKAKGEPLPIIVAEQDDPGHYSQILAGIMKLRQTCNHVDLVMEDIVEEDYDGTVIDYQVAVSGIERDGLTLRRAQSVFSFRKDGDGAACETCGHDYGEYFPSVGLGGVEEDEAKPAGDKKVKKLTAKPLLTKCLHIFCPACFKTGIYPEYKPKMKTLPTRPCSACSIALRLPNDVIEVSPPDAENAEAEEQPRRKATRKRYVRPRGEKPNLSTKMAFLHDDLMSFSRRNPTSANYDPMAVADDGDDGIMELDSHGRPLVTKSVVFSQWTTMLDRIGDMLDEASIKYDRLDGTMSRDDRARAMQNLKSKKGIEVLLVSTRAGGVGLNLTAACRAYLVDPYWNPSVEQQAIDRIHRMGQTRPVTAIKLLMKDTIEKNLDLLQQKKAELANLSLKSMTRKEIADQRMDQLRILFSVGLNLSDEEDDGDDVPGKDTAENGQPADAPANGDETGNIKLDGQSTSLVVNDTAPGPILDDAKMEQSV